MTNNQTNQPFEPFRVQSTLLQNGEQSTGTGRQSGGPGKSGGNGVTTLFGGFDWNEVRWLVMVVFAAIYWITERDPLLRPMTILVLLACLLFRMEGRAREIAA